MPDPTTTPTSTVPSTKDMAATLARLQQTVGQSAPAPAPAPDGSKTDPSTIAQVPGQPSTGKQDFQVQPAAPQPQVINLLQPVRPGESVLPKGEPPPAPAPPRPLSLTEMARENIGKPVQNALAAQTGAPSLAASSDVANAIQQARATQQSVNQRVDSFLRARGYDEPVQLVGTSIDLPATMKKMEAAKLTKRAQAMGYGDWFQVPPGPEQQKAREEVAQEVADDLRHATTVGRGAIFVDPDPLRTNEFLALAPPSLAAAAATVLPRTTATFTPSSAQLRTESPIQPALRAVAAPATVAASAGQRALDTGFFDKIQRGWEAENRAEEADEEGQPEQAVELRADAETYRNDAFRSAVAAATGRSEEQVGDWRTWMFNQGDPEATRALVEKVRTDPMLVQATDQFADDLIRVHRLDGATATAVRTTLNGAGLLGDFFGPDPVTPTFAALGTATRAGLRMAAETGDLARGATIIRDGLTAGKDLGEIVRDADQVYRGLGEALQIRVAAAARVNPDVVSNVRRLQGAAAKAEERVVKAQADLVLARGTVEEKAAARATAQAQADAAKLQVELATAHQQFADEVLAQWDAFGKGNLQRAERLQQVAMETRRESWAAEKALQDMDARNAPTLSRLDKLNQDVLDSSDAVKLATDEQEAAATAIQAAKDRAKAARTAKDKAALDAALLDRKAAEDALALAKERRKNAVVARTATARAQQDALRAAAPALMEQQKAAQRLFDLRAKVAELEQEAGWRILSVADDGKAADDALRSAANPLPSLPESKMRDEQGRLLVGYHASGAAPFSRFEIRTPPPETGAYQGLFGRAVYFADSAEAAESWGKTLPGDYRRSHVGEVGSRYRVVMDVRNPLEMAVSKTGRLPADVTTAVPEDFLAALRRELHVVGGDALVAELDRSLRSGRTGWDAIFALEELLPPTHGTDVFRQAAQRAGYDGVIAHLYDDIAEPGITRFVGDEYAVFNPDRIHILPDAVDVSRVAGGADTGVGVLRKAGLMPDVPPPLGAKSLDEMLARGQLWGDALKEAQVAAKARTLEAQRAFREAQRALGGSERATQKAAEKALREISDLGEAQYKRELATARAVAWKKEAEGLANDIDRGLKALQRKPKVLSERATNILDGALVATAKDGTRTLDTAAFREKIEKAYSPDAVGWWLRHAGDDRAVWERALGLDGQPQAVLSPSDALRLQQGEVGLREGITRTMPEAQALAQTEALLALRKDPALRASSFLDTSINGLGRYYAAKWEAWKKTLDPMVAKVGDVDEKLVLVSKMASRRANLARDELLMVGRLAQAQPGLRGFVQLERGGSREIIRDLTRYMDTTDAIPLMGRASVFNRGEFNETIWDRARRQLLNDPDVVQDASGAAKAEQAAASGDEVVSIPNRPMLGLSRAWVPSGVGINSRQSGQLWKAAVSELTKSTTFDAFQKAMERRTRGIIGSVEHVPDKAVSYLARNAAQAAVQADTADLMVRELGGLLRAEEAADVNRVLTYDWDRIGSPAAAWEGLARVGQPFTQAATRTSREAVAQQQALLRLGTTRGGEEVFAMASQVRALDDTLDKVVKETYAHYAAARTPQEALALSHMLDLQQFWKSSVTIGLVVPSPRYFINNIAGNLSQIWLTQGLGTSARVVGQSLFHNVPFVGTLMERALDAAATRVGDAPFLGSMIEAIWNPNVTRILGGQSGTFRAANGIVYDLETVTRWASEDGVFTSFMQEEYGKLFGRSRGQGPLTRLRYLQDDIFAWANEIEVRQRTALYVDLLRQGYTRSAARERTLRALYDWEGALGAAESAYMTTLIPFYRFIKLGFRQAWYEAVAKPLIRPTEATLEALTGSSGLARMRNQAELLRLPELQDDGDYQTEADKFDALARYRNLDYLNRRVQWTERNDPNMVEMYRGGRGQFMPYSTISLPALTAIDMGNLVTLSLYALPAVALSASGSDMVAPDASQPFWDEATNLAGPLAAPWLGMAAQTFGADSQSTREVARLKPGEAAVAQSLGFGIGWGLDKVGAHDLAQTAREKLDLTNVGPDYQSTYSTAFTKMMVTSMPLLLQAPQWYDALYGENPEVRRAKEQGYVAIEQVAPYFSWAASQLTGFTRSYPFDPDQTLTQHQKKFGEELQKVSEQETGPLRERQAVKP